ncbi:MAG TPA: hypothetical protein V6C89_14845 [Drouetiella sp.]|jgi:hypothetical protein
MKREPRKAEHTPLSQSCCNSLSKFWNGRINVTIKHLFVPTALVLTILSVQPGDGAANGDLYVRLQTTRDALITQERDIRKTYDDVSRQIDELRQKQALLDSYLTQTRNAIRDVERAMGSAQ